MPTPTVRVAMKWISFNENCPPNLSLELGWDALVFYSTQIANGANQTIEFPASVYIDSSVQGTISPILNDIPIGSTVVNILMPKQMYTRSWITLDTTLCYELVEL